MGIAGGVDSRGIAVTVAGSLPAKCLIHIDVSRLNNETDWRDVLSHCLLEADARSMHTVTFPHISYGMHSSFM